MLAFHTFLLKGTKNRETDRICCFGRRGGHEKFTACVEERLMARQKHSLTEERELWVDVKPFEVVQCFPLTFGAKSDLVG